MTSKMEKFLTSATACIAAIGITGSITCALAGAALAATEVTEVTLRPDVQVEDGKITLGDIFANTGEAADTFVANAPEPGKTLSLRPGGVQALARTQGLTWRPTRTIRRIEVSRAGAIVPTQSIMEELERALLPTIGSRARSIMEELERALLPIVGSEEIRLHLSNRHLELVVPIDENPVAMVESVSYDRRGNRFSAVLSVPAGGGQIRQHRIVGHAYREVMVPVLRSAVAPGQLIREADLEWSPMREDRLTSAIVSDAADIIGMSAKRSLRPGRPVRARDLTQPVTVAKGDMVSINLQTARMKLSAVGRALDSGATGEVIRVLNLQSRKTIQATVAAPNAVSVAFGKPIFAAMQ